MRDADLRFYREKDRRIVFDEFTQIQSSSPTRAARLVAKLLDVALADEPHWTAGPDRYDTVDGEQVYLFTCAAYGVFDVIVPGGASRWGVVALRFGNVLGYHGDDWALVQMRLRRLRMEVSG